MKLTDTFNHQYKVTFYERDRPVNRVTAWLGDQPPTPTAGGGGFNVIALPMRSAVSVWQGRANLLIMDIPIMLYDEQQKLIDLGPGGQLHGSAAAISRASPWEPVPVTAQLAPLIRMWRPDDDTDSPPVIRVNAPGSSVPFQHLPYWVSDFTWGAVIGDEDGNRIMQQLTIQVTEYRDDELLQTERQKTSRPKGTSGTAGSSRQTVYVVKAGDTLSAIAARYNLPNGWQQLAQAQNPPITDPRQLQIGARLIIPAK